MTNRNFTPFPILTTERLTLRQLSIDDQQNVFALRSDKEINKYLGRQASKTIEDAINFINRINDNIKNNNSLYWAITLTKTSTFVGTICLFDFLFLRLQFLRKAIQLHQFGGLPESILNFQ